MTGSPSRTVDEYFAAQPEATRRVLERVRSVIRSAVPQATEELSYKIPTFKLHGSVVLHLAGWRNHVSLYPANSRVVEAFGEELAPYLVEKSTLRFALASRIPVKLIERIAKFRAAEISARRPVTGGTPPERESKRRRRR